MATLTYSALVGIVVLSILLPYNWVRPEPFELMLGAVVGLASTAGHWLVVVAYRHAAASVLAPFQYNQLVWASLLGFILFGTIPEQWTMAGACLIFASGVYMARSAGRT